MDILNEILKRRIPQIFGSYIIAGSSLVLFIDWLVTRYQLPEYYVTLALFGIISIIPSVFILAYFHGAPGKDQWTKVEKIGVPINLLFIVTIFFVGHFTNIFSEGSKKSLNNFYIHLTSSENYLNHYYIDYSYGSRHYYDSTKFKIETIGDSLLSELRSAIFVGVSSKFVNQNVNIESSFFENEQKILNKLLFPKIMKPSEKEILENKTVISEIGEVLNIRIEYYSDRGLPDALIRLFIYQVTDLENGKVYIINDNSMSLGSGFKKGISTNQWWVNTSNYNIESEINKLMDNLINKVSRKINERHYDSNFIGEVVEDLGHDMVKIKLFNSKYLKKKMRIRSIREYHWKEGGAEIKIEDLNQQLNYISSNLRDCWNHYYPDEKYEEAEANLRTSDVIYFLKNQITDIEDNLKNNFYNKDTSSNESSLGYFLEVIEINDSYAIAKIIGSETPIYKVRIGDLIKMRSN